jgi:hypothetical protein
MLVGALLYVVRYAHDVPYYDGWSMVEVLGGQQPVDAGWLWQPRNEHRIPLPKLVLLGLYSMSGWDFRAGMYFNVLLLAALAGGMMRVAAQQRGGTSYADAFFPLVLLHWGHYENLLWSWQVTQVIPIVIAGALLAVMVRWGTRPGPRTALLCGLGVAALPLCGIAGLVFVPGFVLWLAVSARNLWGGREERARGAALAAWSLAAAALLLVPLYFVGLHSNARASFDLGTVAVTIARFLAHGFGAAGSLLDPILALLATVITAATVVVLLLTLRGTDRVARSRGWELLFFLVAFGGMAMSVGAGRTGAVAFPNRYALFAVPALCWVYFTWDVSSRCLAVPPIRAGLFLLALSLSALNFHQGLEYARQRDWSLSAMERDIRRGARPEQIIASYHRVLLPFPGEGGAYLHDRFGRWLATLRAARVGAFAALGPERAYRAVPLESVAASTTVMRPDDGTPATRVWTLHPGTFVHGVRMLRPAVGNGDTGALPMMISWRRTDHEPFANDRRGVTWWEDSDSSATFWICESVHEFRMDVGRSAAMAGTPMALLLTPAGEDGTSRVGCD